jgi:hypothetical protein
MQPCLDVVPARPSDVDVLDTAITAAAMLAERLDEVDVGGSPARNIGSWVVDDDPLHDATFFGGAILAGEVVVAFLASST